MAYTFRALGKKPDHRWKVSVDKAWVDGLTTLTDPIRVGDILTLTVKCEKLEHAKKVDGEEAERRVFLSLINCATHQMVTQELMETESSFEKTFKFILRQRGKNAFRAYIFTGDGRIDSSFNRDVYAV